MKKRLRDLAEQSVRQNRPLDSDFLTPEEFSSFLQIQKDLAYADPLVYAPDWERKLIHFGPGQADISLLKIESRSSRFVSLRHPDYLGALIGLGIDRRLIGDILAFPDHADVYVKSSIAPFLLSQLSQVGRAGVRVSKLEALPEEDRPQQEEENIVVSSQRLDKVLAAAFHLSRSKAQEALSQGLVFVDGLQIEKTHYLLSPGQRISLRGRGKIRYLKDLGTTKKGSRILQIVRYR